MVYDRRKSKGHEMSDFDQLQLAAGVTFQSFGEDRDGIILSMQSGYLYRCNSSAVELLPILQNRPTYRELQDHVISVYGIDQQQAGSDLMAFVNEMVEEGLIIRAAA
ncbi:MAG: hypothetical protein RLY14_964 [Planctomycetota bacterium]|jgi:hypothetical protein